jgi:xanthine dehydrogenase YagT iron-sulfur-binding subunit
MKKDPDERQSAHRRGLTRRGFLKSVGVGAAAAVAAGRMATEKAAADETLQADAVNRITLTVNGRRRRLLVEPRWSLLYVLRERLGLTGTKVGCERGECGACTVLIDGVPRYACMTLAVEAQSAKVVTVEGLIESERLTPVQQAFVEHDAFQCGYCTPGQIMAVEGLLRRTPNPGLEEIREAVSGNLCRCGAYAHIFKAAQAAAALKRGTGGEA